MYSFSLKSIINKRYDTVQCATIKCSMSQVSSWSLESMYILINYDCMLYIHHQIVVFSYQNNMRKQIKVNDNDKQIKGKKKE